MLDRIKFHANKYCFLNENNLSFYLLGVYMTDGCLIDTTHHHSIYLSSKDFDWLCSIRDTVCPNKTIYEPKNQKIYKFEFTNRDIYDWLISWGCTPRKSKTLKLEKEIPDKFIKDFLRGVIDGDGCITYCLYNKTKNGKIYQYYKSTVVIYSVSEVFIKQLKSLIPENINCFMYNMGKSVSILNNRKLESTTDMYRLIFNDINAKKLVDLVYYQDHELSLSRKNYKANLIKSKYNL
jgi:hypothetical protein